MPFFDESFLLSKDDEFLIGLICSNFIALSCGVCIQDLSVSSFTFSC